MSSSTDESAWIGDIFTSETGWDHLETLVDIGDRMAGTAGERRAAEATRDALAEFADSVWLDEYDIQGWRRGSTTMQTPAGTERGIALPRSPAESVTGELVDLGYGLPEDFESADIEGKIVLVGSDVPDWYERYIHRREKYYYAVEGGASGFLYKNHVQGCLPPTGSVGNGSGPIGDIPAVGVSKEVGARLGRRFDGEDLTLEVEADIYDATSQNVHGELGPDTDQEILVTSHVDAHDIAEGAMDNGAGTAMVLELAKALAAREEDLDTKVHFITYGSEEVGLVGSGYDARNRDQDTIKAILNLDGVVRERTLSFTTHGFDALGEAAEAVGARYDHPVYVNPEQGPHSDHWSYTKWGVPGVFVASHTDESGRGWGHTEADTLEKLEARTFREQAILLSAMAIDVADSGFSVDHVEPAVIAERLEAEGIAAGMKVTGDWPY